VIERRQDKRYELPLRIAVGTGKGQSSSFEETHLINIGPGGAYFGLKAEMETGAILALTIPNINDGFTKAIGLPSRGEGPLNITLQGEVLRNEKVSAETGERRVAVRFIGPVRLAFGTETRDQTDPRDIGLHRNLNGGIPDLDETGSGREMKEGNGRQK
jgi:hypothetical protein